MIAKDTTGIASRRAIRDPRFVAGIIGAVGIVLLCPTHSIGVVNSKNCAIFWLVDTLLHLCYAVSAHHIGGRGLDTELSG